MAARYLIDTDVLIEYLRGRDGAVKFLEGVEGELLISVISVAELYAGVRGEDEEAALEQFLLAFQVLSVDQTIARVGGLYRHRFSRSHGVGLADTLIAASAEAYAATLVSFNQRHYPMLKHLQIPYPRD